MQKNLKKNKKKTIGQKLYFKREIDILKYDLHLKDLEIGRMIEKINRLKKNA
tara:strand:- start:188 stop:343 length:156 start_codon:yes stop_codon:yes gene_type:complete